MSALDDYKTHLRHLNDAIEWASLIGERFHGGGGGFGYIHDLKVSATIYHQISNGATNYHGSPTNFNSALANVIKEKAGELIPLAIARMKENVKNLASYAVKENESLMLAAGLIEKKDN